MSELDGDIESRSFSDLKAVGVYRYAEDPSTEILMFSYQAHGMNAPATWFPPTTTHVGEPIPPELEAALLDPTVVFEAHNAGFERTMLCGPPGRRILRAEVVEALRPLTRWDCTAARAALFGLPRSLEGASTAAGLPEQKDKVGHALMLAMCKPMRRTKKQIDLRWRDGPADMRRLADYCEDDVRVARALRGVLPTPSATERATWELTERMNDRGVLLDTDLLLRVMFLIEDAEDAGNAAMQRLTGGAVPRVSDHGAITRWLGPELGAHGVGKPALAALLERDDLTDTQRAVLELRQENGLSSASKYSAALERMSPDGRVRGVLVYCGASATARWSSRGLQLHNLPRPSLLKKAARALEVIAAVLGGMHLADIEKFGPMMVLASELLRPLLQSAPDVWLARGDSKQIEARVLPWLCGAEWKLDAFRRYDEKTGPDLYKVAAAGIYHIADPADIGDEDPRRQIGKVSELALGFAGGANALQSMAKNYKVKIPRHTWPDDVPFDEREPAPDGSDEWIKAEWRLANPEAVAFWRALEDAAMRCLRCDPGVVCHVGAVGTVAHRITFKRSAKVMRMMLPSGRALYYWGAKLRRVRMPWGAWKDAVCYMGEDAQTSRWQEYMAYGGLFCENAVQATARDLMAYWLQLGEGRGFVPVLTVHDEGIFELPRSVYPTHAEAAEAVLRCMMCKPEWAAGLPVSADSSAAVRYLKGG